MAHMRMLREFLQKTSALRAGIPLECLLCSRRTPGGLCVWCQTAVLESTSNAVRRCLRCDLLLDLREPGCPDCGSLSPFLQGVVAAFDYAWPGELLIRALKRQGRFSVAPLLADLLAERLKQRAAGVGLQDVLGQAAEQRSSAATSMVVTAVPASRRSLVERGFNPAAEVGRILARRLGLPWRPELVSRKDDGRQQKALGRAARRAEVQGRYAAEMALEGRQVLLVDDVMTTGSTLSAIADVLHEKGASRVWGAVVARTPAWPETREDTS